MKNYLQAGDVVTVAAPVTVSSGDGVLLGKLFGVAAFDAESGADVEIKTRGVFELAKNSAEAWTVGVDIYWDGAAASTADGSGANTLIGKALAIANNPSATGVVRLNG
jgi:predicted RecA/RadA family phage recombinase